MAVHERRAEKVVAYALDMQINPDAVPIGIVFLRRRVLENIGGAPDITVISQASTRVRKQVNSPFSGLS